MARRERSMGIDGGWIGKDPTRKDEGWRAASLPNFKLTSMVVEENWSDYILYYVVESDGTVSEYWRKDRIGFVR